MGIDQRCQPTTGREDLDMKDDRRRRHKRAVLLPDTNPRRFVVKSRPRLSKLTDYPELDFAAYERRLASLQGVLQLIQQAYLGSSERALIVLEGWDTAGKGGVVRRLGWALDGVGAAGCGGRECCLAARTQSGSRHPAGGEAAKETGCQEKDAGCGPPGSIAAGSLSRPNCSTSARTKGCVCSYPGALIVSGGGTVRDQLSLAVTIIFCWRLNSRRRLSRRCVGSTRLSGSNKLPKANHRKSGRAQTMRAPEMRSPGRT